MIKLIAAATLASIVPALHAEGLPDPSMHDIFVATRNGRIEEAKQMIERVLAHHPKSAKAHYTAAEVYARTCDRERARRELHEAQSLQPTLTFVTARSVRELQSLLAQPLPQKCGVSV